MLSTVGCVWCIWPSRTSGRCNCLSSRFWICVPSVSWRHSAEDWSVVKSRNTRFFFFLGILGIVYLYPPPSLLLLTCLGGTSLRWCISQSLTKPHIFFKYTTRPSKRDLCVSTCLPREGLICLWRSELPLYFRRYRSKRGSAERHTYSFD